MKLKLVKKVELNFWIAGAADQMEECLNAVPNKVTDHMQEVLSCEFTAEEVQVALFQMGPTKAPGPDEILQTYERASGQSINLEKSSALFSSNTTDIQKQQLLQILGVKERTELIHLSFHPDDAEEICRIQLSRRQVADSIIWSCNKNGNFSIKSAYKVARKIQGEVRAESSASTAGKKVWHSLWSLKILNKVKVFGWRACTEILPTRANLVRRRVIPDDKCPICLRELETTIHAIWECAAVQDIWAGSCRKLQKRSLIPTDMMQLMDYLMDRLTREELELFWIQAWLAWNQRNRVLFGGTLMDLRILNRRAIFAELDRTGVGAIIRNEHGQVMAAMTASGPKVSSSEEAELLHVEDQWNLLWMLGSPS
ncbi:hypothetical protein SO802_005995 [Lithocarpus litseifolius]|uniref:Reverse transcriptase zinc-binding domain-containing protein n=1 Tax=Lithocarpus litseifolius TaxID=425828 RepID=A0AAW2DK25_9ROSI